ncbi:MAG: SMP-30/gluconolactonase/LRE family protein [SAR324 cluster bacterium]|nr:SMP-30/gluconolactonase/LRE family protein [SAR324 cluster bacterium]
MAEVEAVVECKDILGEGPIWNTREQRLYWCDISRPAIQSYDPAGGQVQAWEMPEEVGSFVFREQGGIVAGLKSGFAFVDLETGRVEPVAEVEAELPSTRLNDGKCDRRGRYWCGSVDPEREPRCGLYRLDADLSCRKMDGGFCVSNGIAWSPDNKTMYFSDTARETVYAYDFDIESGEIANRREFITTWDIEGYIDGATVDAEGFYWCAHIYGGEIARYDPAGKLERTIPLPVRHPTMCTFGGKDLDMLYVTCGTKFVKQKLAHTQPLAGALFAIHGVEARGIPEPFFAG